MSAVKLQEAFARFNAGELAAAARLCEDVLAGEGSHADALHLLGIIHLTGGRAAAAVAVLKRAAAIKPDDAVILENLGVATLAAGRPADAEVSLRRALQLGAGNGLLHMRLGLAVGAQGRAGEAVEILRTAAAVLPDDPDVQVNLGNALAESGQLEAAAQCYSKVLARYPAHLDARFNLGDVNRRMGRLDDAARCLQEVLAQAPDYAEAHTGLGLIYAERGDVNAATDCYRKALEIAPAQVQALNNLGNALALRGEYAEAESYYMRALSAAPDNADISVSLGNLRVSQGRWDEARALYEQAAGSTSAGVDALCNLGKLLRRQARYVESLAYLYRAHGHAPQRTDCVVDIAATYLELGDLSKAEECYRKAQALEPDNGAISRELGNVFKVWGRFEEAAVQYGLALRIRNDDFAALGGLVYVRQHMCDWPGIEALWGRLQDEAIGKPNSGVTPFSILAQPTTPAQQRSCAHAWAQSELASVPGQRERLGFDFEPPHGRPEKLRIGYLSWDLHEHATAYLIAELFELHARDRFEIFAYSYGPDDASAIRARMRNAADRFVDIAKLSHESAARAIYENRIDILVDLKGYTQGARPQIMALRSAPLQVNWLGYPGTMGMPEIDAIIADPVVIPEGGESAYSEQVVRLPDCYQINDRRREISPQSLSRAEYGLPPAGPVFCCFNQSYKILPDVFASWMRILKAIPDSVLWLLETNVWAVQNLRNTAAAQGVAAERLVFAPRRPLAEHLARYRIADFALDTFPYTSHTTASDALWSGCPLLTFAGETFASRVAASILHAAGLPELVTGSLADCEALAIELANSPAQLAALHARLAANRDSCALFDSPRFVRNLEQAYDRLWAERVAGT